MSEIDKPQPVKAEETPELYTDKFQYYSRNVDSSQSRDNVQLRLPGLTIDSKNSPAERLNNLWSWRTEDQLMDKILHGGSLFVADQSKANNASKSAEKPEQAKEPAAKPQDKTRADDQTAKPNDQPQEKKGPVKLEQEKFDTDSIRKAFQLAKENNLPVIVYKGANFCGNCPPVSRAIDNLAGEIKNSPKTDAVIVKLNWERAEQIRAQDPELAKLIDQLMPPNGSSFPDVKVYNPNDLSKPLKDGNGYGGDASYLKSLIKVGQDSLAAGKPAAPKDKSADNKPADNKPTAPKEQSADNKPADKPKLEPQDSNIKPVDFRPAPSPKAGEAKLSDGTYKLDASQRITETISSDGTLKRQFKYEDPSDPKKITSMILNDKTEFKRLSDNSFSVYSIGENGTKSLSGSWFGDMKMDPNGVFTFKQLQEAHGHRRGASAADLSQEEVSTRKNLAATKTESDRVAPNPDKKNDIPATNPTRPGDQRPEAKVSPEVLPDLKLSTFDGKTVKLDDGSYKRDEQGRVTETLSSDGKTKRNFKYEDASNPNRITAETINDKTTYKFIGNCRIGNEPYKIDGKEVNSYSIYDEKGKLTGNWSGVRDISPNGVYSFKDDSMQSIEYRDAGGNKISEEDRKTREREGIWPNQLEITRDDGTKLLAKLNGTRLESLTETSKENGKEKEVVWSKSGDKWTSNEAPARERKNLSIDNNGTVRFDSVDGNLKHELFKDGTRAEIGKDSIRRSYNRENQLVEISQPNGDTRSLKYDGKELVSISDKIAGKERTWSRTSGSDEWTDGKTKETRKDLKVKENGSITFKNSDAKNLTETADLSRVSSDDSNRPLKVEYPSGSSRSFSYKNDRLESVTDKVMLAGKEQSTSWTRKGDSSEFTSPGANGKTRSRTDIEAKENGDFSYKTNDGKDHTSKAYDLERQARGEIVLGSESMQEARDRFVEAASERGLKQERVEKYLNQLDATSKRFGTTPEQMSKALDNLTSILSAEKGKLHSREELNTVVETALHNIAFPAEIDQGYHPTCNVTTTEVFAAARFPEKYTDLVKQVSLNGTYVTSYGSTVTPPEKALKPGRDEKGYDLDNGNIDKRNMASQIYQMTAINGVYELGKHSSQKDGKDDGTRYIMGDVRKKPLPNGFVDLGEDLLVNKSGQPKIGRDGDPVDGPEFIQDDVLTASELVVGKKMPYIDAPYKLENEANWHFDLPTSDRLLKAKADGQFPMGVPTIRGAHVQTIHDVTVDSKGTTWILLDNQHGVSKDGWVTLAELHRTQTQAIQLEPTRKPWQRPE